VILLAGASGAVGTGIRARSAPGTVISLKHNLPVGDDEPCVVGDVSQPRLGLSEGDYRALADEVHAVINCAANVSLNDEEDHDPVNVFGAAEMARFAKAASARLVHVSTAWAAPDAMSEYPRSKWRGEVAVRESGADYVITRSSVVVGDLETGRLESEQGFHAVLEGLVTGPIRVLPGDHDTLLDCVPVDYVADVLLAAAADPLPGARELSLTSGERSISIQRTVEVLNEAISPHDTENAVRAVAMATIDRVFVPVFLPELPRRHRHKLEHTLRLARHLVRAEPFPCSAELVRELYGIELPDAEEVFRANLAPVIADIYGTPLEAAG
jgi:thioester reductase-like protein